MKKILVIVVGITIGAFAHLKVALVNHDNQLLKEIDSNRNQIVALKNIVRVLEKKLEDHEKDAKKAMGIVCEDVSRLRFSVKGIANSLKFVEVK